MDALIIRLATGLGVQNAIGWFPPALFGVMNVLPILLGLFFYADKSSEINKVVGQRKSGASRNTPSHTTQYDFIVVGAGSAGCVVANRLSRHFNVLLLERGGEPNPLTVVPGMQPALIGNLEVDYKYLTIPQNRSCLACINGETFWNAGLGLGGGSMINGMIFIRGHPSDYDRWSKVAKDDRWKYENILPYFLRTEGLCTDCEFSNGVMPSVDPKYHNHDGELPIRPPPISPLVPEFLEAMKWAGVKKGDMNAPYYTEIADTHTYNHVNGRRVSAYNAFVEPMIGNSLKVVKYARVVEILFEEGTKNAIGVKYERFGKMVEVKADKEVIVSAGAIETPKLLMLSGIGPEEDLEQLEIPVKCNLPVGRNLQNHVTSFVGPFLIDEPLSLLPERVFNESAVDAYLKNGTGPYSIMFAHAHTHLISSHARRSGESRWPDIQIHMQANGVSQTIDENLSAQHNFKPALLRQFLEPVKGNDAFMLGPSYSRPKSRGSIRLKSKNYLDHPLIDPNLFSDPDNIDAQVTVEGIQRAVFIAENAPSYKKLGARLSPIPFPSCKHHPHKSKKYWECLILHIPLEVHHFAGTTPMGSSDSRKAVVDSELRVIGASGLRVIDAGVMPYVTSTNTYAPTMMIAERGSDFVIDSYYTKK